MSALDLKLNKIERGSVFHRDFNPLTKNNIIKFSRCNIAAIYVPNGTGKTSLIKTISGENRTNFEFEYDGVTGNGANSIFHVINDQNNRNIIQGDAKYFLLGDNIRHEFELKEYIENELSSLKTTCVNILKNSFKIVSAKCKLIDFINDNDFSNLIKCLANKQDKAKKYNADVFISVLNTLKYIDIPEYDEQKMSFFLEDYSSNNLILNKIYLINEQNIVATPNVKKVEENSEAIRILNYFNTSNCIVCDSEDINREELIKSKNENKDNILGSLDESTKDLLEGIIKISPSIDPFNIKSRVLDVINTANVNLLTEIKKDIEAYSLVFINKLKKEFVNSIENSDIHDKNREYLALIEERPVITDEDLVFIEEIISDSMGKKLELIRDSEKKNLKISLEHSDFLGVERGDLPLSAGEQNFLSLAFEFLRAKNTSSKIIIIDDPISSFDSIYKNKVVYAMIKMLENKYQIILTHNIDLLRLLSAQYKDCYSLYILNNSDNANNGFINVSKIEEKLLINLEELLETFRKNIFEAIEDNELFLISMIPFMRGYSKLIGKKDLSDKLTQVMHGYKNEKIDISKAYHELFIPTGNSVLPSEYIVDVNDILNKQIDGKNILNISKFPLLNKTLKHSLTYLVLRLYVEKELVCLYNIPITDSLQLGQIIAKAFPNLAGGNIDNTRNRVRLTSKKTLINEFNHFEGNLSIFQPAIDITDAALSKEKADIYNFIDSLKMSAQNS